MVSPAFTPRPRGPGKWWAWCSLGGCSGHSDRASAFLSVPAAWGTQIIGGRQREEVMALTRGDPEADHEGSLAVEPDRGKWALRSGPEAGLALSPPRPGAPASLRLTGAANLPPHFSCARGPTPCVTALGLGIPWGTSHSATRATPQTREGTGPRQQARQSLLGGSSVRPRPGAPA